MVGVEFRVCQADGSWSATEPSCHKSGSYNIIFFPFFPFPHCAVHCTRVACNNNNCASSILNPLYLSENQGEEERTALDFISSPPAAVRSDVFRLGQKHLLLPLPLLLLLLLLLLPIIIIITSLSDAHRPQHNTHPSRRLYTIQNTIEHQQQLSLSPVPLEVINFGRVQVSRESFFFSFAHFKTVIYCTKLREE